jgi:prepilin-type N-terminal cleavage/methylation domain-containing protein
VRLPLLSRSRGLTLFELLVVFVIVSVLLTIAIPNMGASVDTAAARSAADAFARTAALARGRALQNGSLATLSVNSVVTGCGSAPVAWAISQGGSPVFCVTATDFASRYHNTSLQANFTQVVYTPTGLATNTFDGLAQFTTTASAQPVSVTIYAGGSVAVAGD